MTGEVEKGPSKEYSSKDISDALLDAGMELGAAALFSQRVTALDPGTLEKRIRKELTEQMAHISTLARFKDARGNFGNKITDKNGIDVVRFNLLVAEEAVKRVTERMKIPKKTPVTFRKDWQRKALVSLESEKPGDSLDA